MEAKETLTAMIILLPLLMLSLCSPVSARPRLQSVRSADNSNPTQHRLHKRGTLTIEHGVFVDMMLRLADANGDGKLSPTEIAYFYYRYLNYTRYVSNNYGNIFLAGDFDGDGLLDRHELLVLITHLGAIDWSRR